MYTILIFEVININKYFHNKLSIENVSRKSLIIQRR